MTPNELKQYRFICRRIERLEAALPDNIVVDSVQGSQKDYPFTKHSVKISGISPEHDDDASELQKLRYKKSEIERYVNDISDPQTREIFLYRYIKGFKWAKVAITVSGDNTADNCRMRAMRYFKKKY